MSTNTPTIVLVHGAFGDSGMWKEVIAKLQAQGYPTLANPLRGLESDAHYAATIANSVDGPVVLVGHSYAGAIITRAARDASNVAALVYVAAVQPDEGESALQNVTRFPGSKMGGEAMIATEYDGEPELRMLPEHYQDVIAGDLRAETTDVLATTQRPVRVQALTAELAGAPAWRTLPSWAVVVTEDNAIPAQSHTRTAGQDSLHGAQLPRPASARKEVRPSAQAFENSVARSAPRRIWRPSEYPAV